MLDAVVAGLGPRAGHLVSALVVVSTFGAIQAVVLTSGRIGFAMARRHTLPAWFGGVSPRFGTPARSTAVVVIAAIA